MSNRVASVVLCSMLAGSAAGDVTVLDTITPGTWQNQPGWGVPTSYAPSLAAGVGIRVVGNGQQLKRLELIVSFWDGSNQVTGVGISDAHMQIGVFANDAAFLGANWSFSGNPLLEELFVQAVWLSPRDAEARGVRDGQAVEVFNARGRIRLPARVTERILPGVVMIPEGAWYEPDGNGTDRGGNPNLLTSDVASPGGAYAYNTARVEIAAA